MTYANDVLAHYEGASAAVRKALADALAAAEEAQPTAAAKPAKETPAQMKARQKPAGGKDTVAPAIQQGAKASESTSADPLTFAEARPDVMLAERAREIAEAEEVDFGTALKLAEDADPSLALRYAERTHVRELCRGASIEPPHGLRLCETRPDLELAERAKARAAADGTTYVLAERAVLADSPKLESRYRDYRNRESALDELSYRAYTIRSAAAGRVSQKKAIDAALAEDPTLHAAVMAYFERAPYVAKAE